MRKGLTRLGVLLTAIWVSVVIGFLAYEYKDQAPIYVVLHKEGIFADETGTRFVPNVKHIFWEWDRTYESHPSTGNTAEYVFSPNTGLIFGFLLGGPLLGWLLSFGVFWVAKGFSPYRAIDSDKKPINMHPPNLNTLTGTSQVDKHNDNLKVVCNVDETIPKHNQYLIFHSHYFESEMKSRLVELICQSKEVFLTIFNKRKFSAPTTWTLTEDDEKYNRQPFEWKRESLPVGGPWVDCYADVEGTRESFRCNADGVIETKLKCASGQAAGANYQTKSLYEKTCPGFAPLNLPRQSTKIPTMKVGLSMRSYAIMVAIIIVGAFVGQSIRSNNDVPSAVNDEEMLNKILEGSAKQINNKAPTIVDPMTRLDRASVGPRSQLNLYYTLTKYSSVEIDLEEMVSIIKEAVRPEITNVICTDKAMNEALQLGGTYALSYSTNDGIFITSLEVNLNDC